MQQAKESILKGLLISRFGDKGPEPIACYPDQFNIIELTEISVKAISILAGEDGVIPLPENLSVLPIPKLHLTAVVYVFEIPNPQARGGVEVGTASILFNEKYSSVIYKTMEDLVKLISPINNFIIKPLQKKENISSIVKRFFNSIEDFIKNRRQDEITRFQVVQEKRYEHQYKFKIIVIGDPRVGKTTLMLRYVDAAFRELYIPTVGVQVSLKRLELDNNILVQLHLWDIAGQEMFNTVRRSFYTGSQAVIIVYDVTATKTFIDVEKWYSDMAKILGKKPGFLIGNKVDLPRQIRKWDGKELADKLNLQFIETSAKSGENVDYVFGELAKILLNQSP